MKFPKIVVSIALVLVGLMLITESQQSIFPSITDPLTDNVTNVINQLVNFDFDQYLNSCRIVKPTDPAELAALQQRFTEKKDELLAIQQNTNNTFTVDMMPWDCLAPEDRVPSKAIVVPIDETQSSASTRRRRRQATTYTYTYVNYTSLNDVTSIKNQGRCGSCYIFATVAAVESAYLIAGKGTQDFSEQQVLDCTYQKYVVNPSQTLQYGCNGGSPKYVAQYFNESTVKSETGYSRPYNTYTSASNFTASCAGPIATKTVTVNYAYVQPTSENHIAYMLANNGPLVIMMYASATSYMNYKSGVYNDVANCNQSVNHAVLLTAVTQTAAGEVWTIKNSWGTGWGEKGYMRFLKGNNMCNMATAPVTITTLKSKAVTS